MLQEKIFLRVRYAETDQMGYVYYGNYPQYFEVARVEALRSKGITYKKMEEQGIMMPVLDLNIKYIRPAQYDDLLCIHTSITKITGSRIFFEYEIYNEKEELLNKAQTTLVFVDTATQRPCRCPEEIIKLLNAEG